MYTAKELSALLQMSLPGFYAFAASMNLSFRINKRKRIYTQDNEQTAKLLQSIELAKIYNQRPYYTLKQISQLMNKDRLTVLSLLKQSQVPIYNQHKKMLVFLCDFLQMRSENR